MYGKSLFVFRRDLRLEDNTGLIQALKNSKIVIPCFIYDTKIKSKSKESDFRWSFLNQSLLDLDDDLKKNKGKLQLFEGIPHQVIQKIIKENKIEGVFLNKDFGPYSLTRDKNIQKICKKNNVDFINTLDFLLHDPNRIKTNLGKPYTIYSHFYKKAKQLPVRKVLRNSEQNYSQEQISDFKINIPKIAESSILGGRRNSLKILTDLNKFDKYEKFRDYPALDYTTKLSAHIKFGTISIREVYNKVKNKLGPCHTLISQIYWREFFIHVLFHFPSSGKKAFNKKFEKIPWSHSKFKFRSWCDGKTGFPIVDAGMNELNLTGFMHNRLRMIVASFLTKDLHIDWRWGERYFAKKLIDYDPAVNIGNWQWAASTGCDCVPYFRIFNPWRQQEKFDKDCKYIKKWIPVLQDLDPKKIHNLFKEFPEGLSYPRPLINHNEESNNSKRIFRSMS